MSREAHTPGPWAKDRHEQLRGSNGEQVGVWGAGIAWVSRSDEAEANARLIAAAPALLEALPDLSSVIAWLDNGCDPKHAADELRIYQKRIDAAIHSATGEG